MPVFRPLTLLFLPACAIESNLYLQIASDGSTSAPPGVDTPVQIDRVVQASPGRSDVLFVVDNSPSMGQEQDELAVNFPRMLEWFLASPTDWHVGVVSTDMADPDQSGALMAAGAHRWLDPGSPDPEETFAEMVHLGTTGAHREQGREAAYTAIELLADTTNAGFVRPDAAKHIVAVSDEDDASGDDVISLGGWVDYLAGLRDTAELVSFSSIVALPGQCEGVAPSEGNDYVRVTEQVGGLAWPICADDWSEVLTELGFLGTGLTREFFLSRLPVVETVAVAVEDAHGSTELTAEDWTYDPSRNSVTLLGPPPDPTEVVVIRYEVAAALDAW